MVLLSEDFEMDKYGVHVRLVNEGDAEFITNLRSDSRLSRFIHASDGDVQKQVEWIREYKKREAAGLDYYFIFSRDGECYGLNRIYNIDWNHFTYTGGSWVIKSDTDVESSMLTIVIKDEIAVDVLGLLVNIYDVRKENTQVLNLHRNVLKAIQYGETDLDYLFMSTPETRKNSKLKKLLGIK